MNEMDAWNGVSNSRTNQCGYGTENNWCVNWKNKTIPNRLFDKKHIAVLKQMDHKDSQFMGCDNNALYIGEYNPRTVAEKKSLPTWV